MTNSNGEGTKVSAMVNLNASQSEPQAGEHTLSRN
jgi:hypothetical protein